MNTDGAKDKPNLLVNHHRMNKIIRHKLRNLCAGVKMAIDRIAEQTIEINPKISERCSIITSELDNLENFSVRMDLLFDSLPPPDCLSLFEIISLSRNFFIQRFPFCTLSINGNQDDIKFIHGSWLLTAIKELLINAGEANEIDGEVKLSWDFENEQSIRLENCGDSIPDEIPLNPPQPFFTLKSRHDGLGLAIADRICQEIDSELSIKPVPSNSVNVMLKLPIKEVIYG